MYMSCYADTSLALYFISGQHVHLCFPPFLPRYMS